MEQMACQPSASEYLITATNQQTRHLLLPSYLTQANSNAAHLQIHHWHHNTTISFGIRTGTKAGMSQM
jgi:hypothetical protein